LSVFQSDAALGVTVPRKAGAALSWVIVLAVLSTPTSVHAQLAAALGHPGPQPQAFTGDRTYPDLKWRREAILTGAGSGLLVTGLLVSPDLRVVPPAGLDPAEISWSLDRRALGRLDVNAKEASDWTRNAAIAFPLAMAILFGEPGHRWADFGARSAVYAEAFLFSLGVTALGKTTVARPRPYAYAPEEQRPGDSDYDVSSDWTFASMPSGHAASAWTGAGLAMSDFLLSRPDAHWAQRMAVGFVGGGLGGATGGLRVQAGMHFPSDVLIGSGVGFASGIAVPLLHRGNRPLPSLAAWLEMLGGAVAGTALGVAIVR
jgi:membrane-associated phospholipid phosphatase